MAAEALIVEDAYQRGYADAIADMRVFQERAKGNKGLLRGQEQREHGSTQPRVLWLWVFKIHLSKNNR